MYRIVDLFDLEHTMAADYLRGFEYPWEALKGIKDLIISLQHNLDRNEYDEVSEQVFVHKTAIVAPTAYLGKPCIILSPTTTIRDQWGERFKESFLPDDYNINEYVNYDLNKINEVLKKHDKNITLRAENITIEEFAEISNELTKQ